MTPLAKMMLQDYCAPKSGRVGYDPDDILPMMTGAKCFDVNQIIDLQRELNSITDEVFDPSLRSRVFLPAPVTFIEWRSNSGNRRGLLLTENNEGKILVFGASSRLDTDPAESYFEWGCVLEGQIPSRSVGSYGLVAEQSEFDKQESINHLALAYAFLFLINTPNLLGRKTHLPHAGLQRRLAKATGGVGKFPLQAWTELKLYCSATDGASADAEDRIIEAQLSGQRCLHFVRAFLRKRRGKIEVVKSHWRGDAALGIKRSRYIAEPAE